MKEFLARLNPTERRFVVGVAVVFFLVINIVWVWPHFADWSQTSARMTTAGNKVVLFQGGTNQIPGLQKEIEKYQGRGEIVPSADTAVRFVRLIQNQTAQFGFVPDSMTPTRQASNTNNPYFVEQGENLAMQTTEKQLVDFLYSLGSGSNSLIRVKVLSVQPDPSHQRLTSRVTLVASYQAKAVGPAPAGAGAVRKAAPGAPAPAPAQKPAPGPATPASAQKPAPATATNAARPFKPFVPTNHPPTLPPGQTGAVKPLTPPKK